MGIGFARFRRNSDRKGRANAHRGFDTRAKSATVVRVGAFSTQIEDQVARNLHWPEKRKLSASQTSEQ
jgi:hypothetical protein